MSLHVFKNGVVEWFVAESIEDAVKVATEYFLETCNESELESADLDFEQLPDDELLTIVDYDQPDGRSTKLAGEWAKEHGRGLLCSTEF